MLSFLKSTTHRHTHIPYTCRYQPLTGLTAQRAKNILSCNHGNNPVRQGSWLHLVKEEEEGGVLAGTGAVTGPGLPSAKWESSPMVFTTVGEVQTFPRVAKQDPHTQRTFLLSPKLLLGTPSCSSTFPLCAFLLSGTPSSAYARCQPLHPAHPSRPHPDATSAGEFFLLSTAECKGASARVHTAPCPAIMCMSLFFPLVNRKLLHVQQMFSG